MVKRGLPRFKAAFAPLYSNLPMPNKLPGGLYALIDDQVHSALSPLDKARLALEGGALVVQLRLKHLTDRQALETIVAVLAMRRQVAPEAVVLVNDRVDWALVAGADGVHVGADDLPPDAARRLLGPEKYVGVTTRNVNDILTAARLGADHVGLGPIFETRTKTVDAPPLGLEAFGRIAHQSPLPVVGIAGITLDTIGAVARAGAHAAAVAGDLLLADDIAARAKALQQAFWRAS